MLQKITFKDKHKTSLDYEERIITDININQIKSIVNSIVEYINDKCIEKNKIYTKQQIDQLLYEIQNNISNNITFDNVYTKQQIDEMLNAISNTIVNDYYTKQEITNIINNLDNSMISQQDLLVLKKDFLNIKNKLQDL